MKTNESPSRLVENILRELEKASRISPAGMAARLSVKQPDKIRLNCTVAFFSALMRVLCDRNLVDKPNVSDLCRKVSGTCSTTRQQNLSPRSIRNHFDDPSPDVLEALLNEFRMCGNYTANLIQRQRR